MTTLSQSESSTLGKVLGTAKWGRLSRLSQDTADGFHQTSVCEHLGENAISVNPAIALESIPSTSEPVYIVTEAVRLAATNVREHRMSGWQLRHPRRVIVKPQFRKCVEQISHGTQMDDLVSGESISWRLILEEARDSRQITDMLRFFGEGDIAKRIDNLRGLHQDDPEEPRIVFESLRTFVCFLMSERQLPKPAIGLGPSGHTIAQWRIPPDGILAMEFLPNDWIRFAGIGSAPRPPNSRQRVSGTLGAHQVMKSIRFFSDQIQG